MNSLESDLRRAILSKGFFVGTVIELIILLTNDIDSEMFRMSIPLICALPYSCGWLNEYKCGFTKFSLSRADFKSYICSKFFAAGFAGGLAEVLGVWIFAAVKKCEEAPLDYRLLFLSAFLWAAVATTLASVSESKYLAYGGAFVIYYFLIILYERYFSTVYCLNPYEWVFPSHTWILGNTGIELMLTGLIIITACIYYAVIRRRLERV